jgi:glycosyltransferase involved in cell wall biosynthesis
MSTEANPCVALLRHQLFLPSEVFITEQARAMQRFAPLLIGRTLCGRPAAGVDYHVPAAGRLTQLQYVLQRDPRLFMPELTARRPALVHAHFGVEAVYGMRLAERLGVPLVTTFHGFDATLRGRALLTSRKPTWLQYWLNRNALQRGGALFIGVSHFVAARLARLGFPAARTHAHYIGVDVAELAAPIAGRAPILLHVARLVEQKGTAYLLDAFAQLARKHSAAELVVIGAGPEHERLVARAAALGIAGRVRWLGAQPHSEVKRWLKKAAVFCLPGCTTANGATEGLGLVLVEAAASGVPVVATRHGGIPEAVEDGVTGHLVAERDVGALAEGLDVLLSSESLRCRMGEAGVALAHKRFDLHKQTHALEKLYESVL